MDDGFDPRHIEVARARLLADTESSLWKDVRQAVDNPVELLLASIMVAMPLILVATLVSDTASKVASLVAPAVAMLGFTAKAGYERRIARVKEVLSADARTIARRYLETIHRDEDPDLSRALAELQDWP